MFLETQFTYKHDVNNNSLNYQKLNSSIRILVVIKHKNYINLQKTFSIMNEI